MKMCVLPAVCVLNTRNGPGTVLHITGSANICPKPLGAPRCSQSDGKKGTNVQTVGSTLRDKGLTWQDVALGTGSDRKDRRVPGPQGSRNTKTHGIPEPNRP